ncbi:MAG: transposase, partial [Planctomycetaceae bacterium]|nr:transposase [Planctomycetaceae bacterium]
LLFHPHLHCVVTGGALSPDGTRWIAARPDYFLPVKVLSRLFRGKFLAGLKNAFESGALTLTGRIRRITRQTVKNIMKEAGLNPGPERGEGTWDDFLKRHMDTLWQCDFLSVKSLTKAGFVDLYLLAFIHLGTRRAWISLCTAHPDSAWVTQQGRNFLMHADDVDLKPEYVQHDRDTKFTAAFDEMFEATGVTINKTVPHSPNLNAFIERFIQTAKQEVFSRFVICGEKHLNHLARELQTHYNFERSHSSREYLPPALEKEPEPVTAIKLADVACETRLGGLLKHYWRRAA